MKKKMETTIAGYMKVIGCIYIYIYRGYIGIMERKMEAAVP